MSTTKRHQLTKSDILNKTDQSIYEKPPSIDRQSQSSIISTFSSENNSNLSDKVQLIDSPKFDKELSDLTMVGGGKPTHEETLTSCKATAMVYNDQQKKWLTCATTSNGPAKVQLLYSQDANTYRIVGRQIQDHEVVLNHMITKGIKCNRATPTFLQWRDQSSVYGLNFMTKIEADEFGACMSKILETVNNNNISMIPIEIIHNNNINNNNSLSSLPISSPSFPTSTISRNSTNTNINTRQLNQLPSTSSSTSSPTTPSLHDDKNKQQSFLNNNLNEQQQHCGTHPRQTSNLSSAGTTYYAPNTQQQQQQQQQQQYTTINNYISPPGNHNSLNDEDETNNHYALISDSYSFTDTYNTNNRTNNNTLQRPSSPQKMAAAPPPPPPPPPGGLFAIPAKDQQSLLNPNTSNTAIRKTTTSTTPPTMDLMTEMQQKIAQRRRRVGDTDHTSGDHTGAESPSTGKANTLKPSTPSSIQNSTIVPTSPRVTRKTELTSTGQANLTSNDVEKLKQDILIEVRKEIDKAKQEIIQVIIENFKK